MEEQNIKKRTLSDYIYVLFKWKKFLIINSIIIIIIATTLSFLIPKTYKATSVVMLPPENSMNIGGIAGLISGKSSPITSLSSKLLGGGSSLDIFLGILNSRTELTDAINRFNLIQYYHIADSNMDKAIKAFRGDVNFDQNEYSMIEISVINKDPKMSAEIANYLVSTLDSINIKLNSQAAKNNAAFIGKRYKKNINDLKTAEDAFYIFQKKYGVLAVPEQLEATFKTSAELEAKLVQLQLQTQIVKEKYGDKSPIYLTSKEQENFIQSKINNMSNSQGDISNFIIPYKLAPKLVLEYYRDYREIEIQSKIMAVLLPMYEQAKVEENKSVPTIMVLDKAIPPELKYAPKKSIIIILVLLIFLFFAIPFVFMAERVNKLTEFKNPIEEKEKNFIQLIKKIYKLKIK
jgi:tyrosine-protein kinase Etk/Wzc